MSELSTNRRVVLAATLAANDIATRDGGWSTTNEIRALTRVPYMGNPYSRERAFEILIMLEGEDWVERSSLPTGRRPVTLWRIIEEKRPVVEVLVSVEDSLTRVVEESRRMV